MSTMDVSLRLRLLNQLSRPAGEAERDLKDLKKTAEQLGRVKGSDTLARGLVDVGRKADAAKSKLGQVEKEADQLRRAIGKTGSGFNNFKTDAAKAESSLAKVKDSADNTRLAIARIGGGFGNLKADAISAEASLKGVEQQSNVARAAIGRVGDGAFSALNADAAAAESAIKQIGAAADAADAKLRSLRGWSAGGRTHAGAAGVPGAGMSTIEGAVDQFGLPVAIGAGGAYLAGALPAGAVVVGGAAVNAAAGDEQRSDALRVTGEYDEKEQKRIDAILARSGAERGVGTAKAQETYGALISNGVSAPDAAVMTDQVTKVAKATSADPVDVAGTAVSLRQIMKIDPQNMMSAYESIAAGGKLGKFEVKDVAKHGPSLFAAMASQGSTGIESVRLTTAMAQSIAAVSGSNDQAKTSFEAMLTDMVSPDVAERFEKTYGKNIYDIRKNAVANGQDPVIASLQAYRSAVGGDEEKTRDLFRNSEAYKGYAAVFGDFDLILKRMAEMKNASGTIDKDYETNTGNFNSQKDRLTSNFALNIKTLAAPLLPLLTSMAEKASLTIETARQNEQTNPLTVAPSYGVLEWLTKLAIDPGGEGRPSAFKRFLIGDAANSDFNLRQHMGISTDSGDLGTSTGNIPVPTPRPDEFGQAAKEGMAAYNTALSKEGEAAKAEASSIAEYIKSVLGFTVSPTISPTFVSPAAAPAAPAVPPPPTAVEQQSSLQQSNNIRQLTQNITTPNVKLAAVKARREQSRAIEQARSRSFYDLGPRLA